MKRIYLFFTGLLFICFMSSSAKAKLDTLPDFAMLVSDVKGITFVNNYAVAVTNEGLAVFQYDSNLTKFVYQDQIFLRFNNASMKVYDSVLVVNVDNEKLYFYDLTQLPALINLGVINFKGTFGDFIIKGNDLYVSRWFDGVWRYYLTDFNHAQFVDSSMKGILVTQLEEVNDTLYVLDEYNGLLRYDLSTGGFGSFINYLYVPLQVASFIKYDSLFCLLLKTGNVYFGDFNKTGSMIVDSIINIPSLQKAYVTDSLLILVGNRQINYFNRSDISNRKFINVHNTLFDGGFFIYQNQYYFVLPNLEDGVTMYDLNDNFSPHQGLEHGGGIADMLIYDSKLFISGNDDPVEVYRIDDSSRVSYDYTIYDLLNSSGKMTHNGDTLFTFYPNISRVALITKSTNQDSLFLENSFYFGGWPLKQIIYNQEKIGDFHSIMLVGNSDIDIYTISDSGFIDYASQLNIGDNYVSVKDSFMYITSYKDILMVYKIDSNFNIDYENDISLQGYVPHQSIVYGNKLILLETDKMDIVNISSPPDIFIDTTFLLPFQVSDAKIFDDKLYTVGFDGVGIFDISSPVPELIEFGGRGGDFLTVDSNIIATSNGHGIYIYKLNNDTNIITYTPDVDETPTDVFLLSQNYPNPFNLETTINYAVPKKGKVILEIYNILGEKINTLVDGKKDAGHYSVSWKGQNSFGQIVASGVYFYRLIINNLTTTKKMVLLK